MELNMNYFNTTLHFLIFPIEVILSQMPPNAKKDKIFHKTFYAKIIFKKYFLHSFLRHFRPILSIKDVKIICHVKWRMGEGGLK